MRPATLSVILLAGGDGSRMHSGRPEPLHRLCGRPMVHFVLDAVAELAPARVVVVVGPGGQRVAKELADMKPVTDVVDTSRFGSVDAALAGVAALVDDGSGLANDDGDVIIVGADVPLLTGEALAGLVDSHLESAAAATVLVGETPDPGRRPRVVRSERDATIERLVPDWDLVGTERQIAEFATSAWCVRQSLLAPALRRLKPAMDPDDSRLSGLAEVLSQTGHRVETHCHAQTEDLVEVDDRVSLAAAEAVLRSRINERWLKRGVTMVDPERTYVDATVTLAPDVTLFPGIILQGQTVIGEGSEIGPGSRLVDTRVGSSCRLEQVTAQLATIGDDCRVGPYATLEPGAQIPDATITGPLYNAGPDGP